MFTLILDLTILISPLCLLSFLLTTSSRILFTLTAIFIFCLTVLATYLNFPFWKIYLPQTGLIFGFTLLFIILPIAIFNIAAFIKGMGIIKKQQNCKNPKAEHFILFSLTLGCLFLGN